VRSTRPDPGWTLSVEIQILRIVRRRRRYEASRASLTNRGLASHAVTHQYRITQCVHFPDYFPIGQQGVSIPQIRQNAEHYLRNHTQVFSTIRARAIVLWDYLVQEAKIGPRQRLIHSDANRCDWNPRNVSFVQRCAK
jgi:hypothetical protein